MSVSRTLTAPLVGTAVAGVILYGVGSSLSARTHQVTAALHNSSYSLRRLANVDDTDDLIQRAHVAPDTAAMVAGVDHRRGLDAPGRSGGGGGGRGKAEAGVLPAAYQPPSTQSLTEQIKARWNEHVTSFAHAVSESDVESAFSSVSYFVRSTYARATGQDPPALPASGTSNAGYRLASSLQALAPSTPQSAAALRDPVPPATDVRLWAPNTNYMGQGASLR